MKPKLPLQMTWGNLIAAQTLDDVWAVYRIDCRSYRAEPERRKAALAFRLQTFAHGVQADFQILRVTRRWDAQTYVDRLAELSTPHGQLWDRYLHEQQGDFELATSWLPTTWLMVRLADPDLDPQARAQRLFEQTPKELLAAVQRRLQANRTRTRVVMAGSLNLDDITSRAAVVHAHVTANLDAHPASPEEIQWLIRRPFYRGIGEPTIAPAEEYETPYEAAQKSMVRWLSEDGVRPQYRQLQVTCELGDYWQTGLCLGEMGHAIPFTQQTELLFSALEDYPWPLDACLSVRWIPNDQAMRQARGRFQRSASQLADEEGSTYGAMDESYEPVALSKELHHRLTTTGEPMLRGVLSLMCSAPTVEDLNRRVRQLKANFPWPLYRPLGNQMDVFLQHLPAQRPRVPGFDRPFTTEQVGGMVPHGTHEAGSTSARAMYIAHTIYGRHPVLFDLLEASQTNRAPTIALLGTLGGGKTMFLQLLLWQAFVQGARIVDVDPKGDHRFHEIPEVLPHTRVIRLGPESEHAGKLDPLRIAPEAERHDAAASFLIDVLPPVEAEVQAAVSGAITRVMRKHGERACCMEVIRDLDASSRPEDQRAGYLLRQFAGAGLVRLGFASLDTPLPSASQDQVTYLQIRALKRAHINTVRSEMTQSQRHSRAILQLVALYAMRILAEDQGRAKSLKVLSFDEASFITEDAVGRQLLDTLERWARSEMAVPILSTQLLPDLIEQDNLIGHWFLFAMQSRDHAVQALRMLEMDDEGPLAAALVERYGGGKCLYRDLDGHCEEIQVDLGKHGLLESLSTTPVVQVAAPEEEALRLLVNAE